MMHVQCLTHLKCDMYAQEQPVEADRSLYNLKKCYFQVYNFQHTLNENRCHSEVGDTNYHSESLSHFQSLNA